MWHIHFLGIVLERRSRTLLKGVALNNRGVDVCLSLSHPSPAGLRWRVCKIVATMLPPAQSARGVRHPSTGVSVLSRTAMGRLAPGCPQAVCVMSDSALDRVNRHRPGGSGESHGGRLPRACRSDPTAGGPVGSHQTNKLPEAACSRGIDTGDGPSCEHEGSRRPNGCKSQLLGPTAP